MEKTFIEGLWAEKPELVKAEVAKILHVDEKCLVYRMVNASTDHVRFEILGKNGKWDGDCVLVTDLKLIRVREYPLDIVKPWIHFMYENCGTPYAMKFISRRNKLLDSRLTRIKREFNKETEEMLDDMGFDMGKGYIK